jgi:hypothetical protein
LVQQENYSCPVERNIFDDREVEEHAEKDRREEEKMDLK